MTLPLLPVCEYVFVIAYRLLTYSDIDRSQGPMLNQAGRFYDLFNGILIQSVTHTVTYNVM